MSSLLTTIAAGALMLPPVLVILGTAPVVALLSLPGLALLCYQRARCLPNNNNNKDKAVPTKTTKRKRAIITGGSSGIGLCVAQECLSGQQHDFDEVIVLARTVDKLRRAKEMLQKLAADASSKTKRNTTVRIEALSVDVSNPADLNKVAKTIFDKDADTEAKTSTYLFCVAGQAYPEYFEKISAGTFQQMIQTNQLGTIYTVQAFLPHMTSGTIMMTSSMAGQVGMFGYTAYTPTKFALRGFAEVLHMELVGRPISVCVAYPPNTDTPGFAQENETKPKETHLLSEDGGLAQPETVARTMVQKVCQTNPNFSIYFSFDGWMLSALTCGFAPVTSVGEAISQVCGMGLFRVVSLFYLKSWHGTIQQLQKNNAETSATTTKSAPSKKDDDNATPKKEEDTTAKSSD